SKKDCLQTFGRRVPRFDQPSTGGERSTDDQCRPPVTSARDRVSAAGPSAAGRKQGRRDRLAPFLRRGTGMRNQAVPQESPAVASTPQWTRARLIQVATGDFHLLPVGAVVALVWANTATESYFRVSSTLAFAVNEIGMAVVLGLITQEIVEAAMPGAALH